MEARKVVMAPVSVGLVMHVSDTLLRKGLRGRNLQMGDLVDLSEMPPVTKEDLPRWVRSLLKDNIEISLGGFGKEARLIVIESDPSDGTVSEETDFVVLPRASG